MIKNSQLQLAMQKISKTKKQLIHIDELFLLTCDRENKKEYGQKFYKILYYLKQRGYLCSLKKDLFVIKSPQDERTEEDFIALHYRNILSTHCKRIHKNNRYIGGETALALHLQNYSIPEQIMIANEQKQGYETLLTGRKIQRKNYSHQQKNISISFIKLRQSIAIGGHMFPVAALPLALLESLYNNNPNNPILLEQIKKVLKKTKDFNIAMFHTILKLGKHHSSINHLYQIAKTHHPKLAEGLAEVIKKWSFFLSQ